MSGFDGIAKNLRRYGEPGTVGLIAAIVGAFLVSWLFAGSFFTNVALTPGIGFKPWTLLTYPFAHTGIGYSLCWWLLLLYWMWIVGSQVERDLGTAKYVATFFALTLLAGIFIVVGYAVISPRAFPVVQEPWLPISGLTVLWGVRNRSVVVQLMGVIPMSAAIVAWLDVALTLLSFGTGAPLMGVFAILHLGAAYLFATDRMPGLEYGKGNSSRRMLKATERRDASYYDDVRKREHDRQERERLRKLFEGSVNDDANEG